MTPVNVSGGETSLRALLAATSLDTISFTPTRGSSGIVTHDGPHHADEALAVWLLRQLPRFSNLKLTRTRDQALIDKAVVVVDVGQEYDLGRLRFDHHQISFNETFDAEHEIKLSSAGLIWKHFGEEIIANTLKLEVDSEIVRFLWIAIYDDYIQAIDGIDNGIRQFANPGPMKYRSSTGITYRVKNLNPAWNEVADNALRMERFEKASAMIGEDLRERLDYLYRVELPAKEAVAQVFEARKAVEGGDPGGKILVLERPMSWKRALDSLNATVPWKEKAQYIVSPNRSDSDWHVHVNRYAKQQHWKDDAALFPKAWRGLRDEDLVQKVGVEGLQYVHAGGHVAGTCDRASALALARKCLLLEREREQDEDDKSTKTHTSCERRSKETRGGGKSRGRNKKSEQTSFEKTEGRESRGGRGGNNRKGRGTA